MPPRGVPHQSWREPEAAPQPPMGITEATAAGGGGTPGHADAPLAAPQTGPQHGLLGRRRCLTVGRARLSHARFAGAALDAPTFTCVVALHGVVTWVGSFLDSVAYTFAAATYYYAWCQRVVSSYMRELAVGLRSIGGIASIQGISRARWCVFCRCTGDINVSTCAILPTVRGRAAVPPLCCTIRCPTTPLPALTEKLSFSRRCASAFLPRLARILTHKPLYKRACPAPCYENE